MIRNRLRLWYYLARGDMNGLGWWLRRSLPEEEVRRSAMTLLRDTPLVVSFRADGFDWTLPVGDEIARELFATGRYSGATIDALDALFGAGTLLEIGANVGTTTLPFASRGWRVVAVEPVPDLFHFLQGNVERNDLASRVCCINAAAAAIAGTAEMVIPTGMYGSSYIEGLGHFDGNGARVEVRTATLSTLLAEAGGPSVTLVWCDAEGSELAVIEDGAALWRAGVPLYVEMGRDSVVAAAAHFESFSTELALRDWRPIGELAAALPVAGAGDVLLLPHGVSAR